MTAVTHKYSLRSDLEFTKESADRRLAKNPDDLEALSILGICLIDEDELGVRDLPKAYDCFEKVIAKTKEGPAAAHAWTGMAKLHCLGVSGILRQNYDIAQTLFEKAVQTCPTNHFASASFAIHLLEHTRDRQRAITLINGAETAPALYAKGLSLLQSPTADYDTARNFFEKVLKINPNHKGAKEKIESLDEVSLAEIEVL